MDEKKINEQELESVRGVEFATVLYRCPNCGREGRMSASASAIPRKCIVCNVNMVKVDDSDKYREFG